ncbi:hypothetical protein [Lacrimispora sp.]|uniref:hypothetical protein n=1 Tax=Lacrimispora sp. TaxID=2719234 RepID=UPI0028AE6C5D|nr:hypothetical protein [Lacrimispora sp.]
MEYFNLIPLLIAAMILFMICAILLELFIKVKKSQIWFLIIVLVITTGAKIYDQIINSVFYGVRTEMYREYPEIDSLKLHISQGRLYSMEIVLKKEIDAEKVEDIFVKILKRINKEPMSSYLKDRSVWVEFHVNFRGAVREDFDSGRYSFSEWFTKENQQEQTWHNSKTGKEYRYSNYIE